MTTYSGWMPCFIFWFPSCGSGSPGRSRGVNRSRVVGRRVRADRPVCQDGAGGPNVGGTPPRCPVVPPAAGALQPLPGNICRMPRSRTPSPARWPACRPSGASCSSCGSSAGGPTCAPASTRSTRRRWPPRSSSGCCAAAAHAYAQRPADLHRLDQVRTLAPDWFQQPPMLGYAAYADRFGGDLAGVREQIPYLRELGVTYLHLMPLLRPREGDSDGGYAVADYRAVRPDLGTVDDLVALARGAAGTRASAWCSTSCSTTSPASTSGRAAARAGDAALPRLLPRLPRPRRARRVRAHAARGLPRLRARQLHLGRRPRRPGSGRRSTPSSGTSTGPTPTCSPSTPTSCCGWPTPASRCCAWTRSRSCGSGSGTNCQNQPEVHAIAQALRALHPHRLPGRAAQGRGDRRARRPRALPGPRPPSRQGQRPRLPQHADGAGLVDAGHAATSGSRCTPCRSCRASRPRPRGSATCAATTTSAGPSTTPTPAAVGLTGSGHRAFLSDFYPGAYPGSFARGLVFQANPATGDRRVSGMTAALAGLDAAGAAGDAAAVERAVAPRPARPRDRARLGRRAGALDGRRARAAVRPGLGRRARARGRQPVGAPPADGRRRGRPQRTDAGTVHGRGVRRPAPSRRRARRACRCCTPSTQSEVLDPSDPGVLPVLRSHPEGELLELFNVTETWRPFPAAPAGRTRALARLGRAHRHRGRGSARRQRLARALPGAVAAPLAPHPVEWSEIP